MVGLSGSGKSTITKEQYSKYVLISSDKLREELYNDVNDQSHNHEIFEEMYRRSIFALNCGKDVVYDATNLNAKRRTALINRVRGEFKGEVRFIAHIVATSIPLCLARNASRDRVVPEDVIMLQLKQFQLPTKLEGFNDITITLSENKKERETWFGVMQEEMKKEKHDNPHHPDTIYNHCFSVMKTMIDKDSGLNNNLCAQIGFYHDIGKIYTKFYDDEGIAHYHGHDNASSYIALMQPTNTAVQEIYLVSMVIGFHMKRFSYKDRNKYLEWKKRLPITARRYLDLLLYADAINSVT
jgi:predicted kinase